MRVLSIGKIETNESNRAWYERKGYTMTGETIEIEEGPYLEGENSSITVYVIFRGSWTRYGTVRDCGDHYIKANYSSYSRIDKNTLEITNNVEDI